MDVEKAIEERRSVRKYKDKPLPEETIRKLIDAARLAPSGNNSQPWRYFLVKDAGTKEKLKQKGAFKQNFVYEAGAIIVCCADPDVYRSEYLDDPNERRAVRDLSISSSFLVLRATELGLGTCYVGWVEREKIKKVLDIPKEYVLPYVITVGYPDEEPGPSPRKDVDEILS